MSLLPEAILVISFLWGVWTMENRRSFPEEKTPEWVETVSLVVDALGMTTILFLTGVLLLRCFY